MTDANQPNGNDKLHEDSAKRPFNPDGGEDESGASQDVNDTHLDQDQKPETGSSAAHDTAEVADDDAHKTEKLTKAGRDIDPDGGAD